MDFLKTTRLECYLKIGCTFCYSSSYKYKAFIPITTCRRLIFMVLLVTDCFLCSYFNLEAALMRKKVNELIKRYFRLRESASFILIIFLSLCLGACEHYIPTDEAPKLPRKVMGAADHQMVALKKDLERLNVKVITIGSEYLISIPATALFPPLSPRLTWKSYAALNLVVDFLKQFRKIVVNVTGYGTTCYSEVRERALTKERARVVADYLACQGIDSRFIFTVGAGSDKPIMFTTRGCEQSLNARIEITFREALI